MVSSDFVIALFFLFSLIAVERFKNKLSTEDKEGYNYIIIGVTVLAFLTVARLYSEMGLLKSVPFVSEPLFFRLLYWIGVIAGITFLISGVLSWLPLSRAYRAYNKDRVKRLELIKKVEQLVRVETRLPVIFEKVVAHAVDAYDLYQAAAYVVLENQGSVVLAAASGNNRDNLKQIRFRADCLTAPCGMAETDSHALIEFLPADVPMPDHIIPVCARKKSVGVILVWTREKADRYDDDRANLKIAADIIGHKIESDVLTMTGDFHADVRQWHQRLGEKLDHHRDARDNVLAVTGHLRPRCPFDLFVLTIVHEDNTVQRISVGENSRLLNEVGLDFQRKHCVSTYVYNHGEAAVIKDALVDTSMPLDDIMSKAGVRSLVVLPVKYGSKTEAVLAVGSKVENQYGARQLAYINNLVPVIANLVKEERYRHIAAVNGRRTFALNNFMSEVYRLESINDVFRRAASVVAHELKPTMVRIATFDEGGTFLNSRAMELARPLAGITPTDASMVISLMPYHRLVQETGRPMMVNQENTERRITEAEQQQMFGLSLKSALIVPLKVDGDTVGAITLAEMRKWNRYQFREGHIQFVTSMASVLSMAVQLELMRKNSRLRKIEARTAIDNGEFERQARSRMKSSLTGIMGSVEILKSSKQPRDENLDKYLSIIDKSAQRIGEYFEDKVPG